MVDGMRTVALKLAFGAFHNQIFERFIFCLDHDYVVTKLYSMLKTISDYLMAALQDHCHTFHQSIAC